MDSTFAIRSVFLFTFLLSGWVSAQSDFIPLDTVVVHVEACDASASICIGDFPQAVALNHSFSVDSQPYEGQVAGCDFDTISAFTYSTLFGQGDLGPYYLDSWLVNNVIFSGIFQDIPALVDSMNLWDPQGNWILDAGSQLITGGYPGNTYSDMDVTVVSIQSPSFIGYNFGLNALGTQLDFQVGFHQVIATSDLSGESDTFYVHISCATPDTVYLQMQPGQAGTFCPDDSQLNGTITGAGNSCGSASGQAVELTAPSLDYCFDLMAIAPGFESACLVLCDDLGICDTTMLYVQVVAPVFIPEYVYDTLYMGQEGVFCIDTTGLVAPVVSAINICDGNGSVDFQPLQAGYCLPYVPLNAGIDTACYVLTDIAGNSDTTYFFVTSIVPVSDTVFLEILLGDAGEYCVETTELGGAINSFFNECPQSAGSSVLFDLDLVNYCVDYEGIFPGQDTACLLLGDNLGMQDTTVLIVTVVLPSTQSMLVLDTLSVGETLIWCLDTTELLGNVEVFDNICFDLSGNAVNFALDSTGWCISATGIAEGIDTACIAICDGFGICDTTVFIYTSLPPLFGAPVANDDYDTTGQSVEVYILVFDNDQLPQNATDFGIVAGSEPIGGSLNEVGAGVIFYTPEAGFCGLDSFQYYVCSSGGCDTATVYITVECVNELVFFSAITPDGDGTNDTWVIEGLELAPDHRLMIFTRWGLRVLETDDYQNDWGGRWGDRDLPDGTYFYLFEDQTGGKQYSGYIQIYH